MTWFSHLFAPHLAMNSMSVETYRSLRDIKLLANSRSHRNNTIRPFITHFHNADMTNLLQKTTRGSLQKIFCFIFHSLIKYRILQKIFFIYYLWKDVSNQRSNPSKCQLLTRRKIWAHLIGKMRGIRLFFKSYIISQDILNYAQRITNKNTHIVLVNFSVEFFRTIRTKIERSMFEESWKNGRKEHSRG